MPRWRLLGLVLALLAPLAVIPLVATPAAANTYVRNANFSLGQNADWVWHPLSGVENCCAGPPAGYPNAYAHPNGAGDFIVPWQNIPGLAAGTYTLSGRIRTSGGAQQAWIQADWGVFTGRWCSTAPTNTTGWVSYSCRFTIPAGQVVHVALAASNAPSTAWGWVAFDDISLTGGGVETGPYDLAEYMMRTNGTSGPIYQFTSGETMQVQYEPSVNRYYQTKNGNWEEMSYNPSYILRYRDSSLDADEWYGLYEGTTPGSNWARRYMNVGETFNRNPMVRFYYKNGCGVSRPHGLHGTTIKLEARYASHTVNGYNVGPTIWLRGYNGGVPWEDFYYAKGIGLVHFRAYDTETGATVMDNRYNGPGGSSPTRIGLCTP